MPLPPFGLEAFRAWIIQFGLAAPFLYVILYAANTVVLVPPVGILSLTAGLVFGPIIGFIAIMAGAMAGISITFWISRRFGREFVERRLKGRFKSLDQSLSQKGFATVLFFRLVPIVPYEALNYLSGLSSISFRNYFLSTFLGIIPGTAITVWFSNSLRRPLSGKFFLALLALVILAVIPVVYLKVKARRKP